MRSKMAETDRDAVWNLDSGGPKEPCVRWGPDSPMRSAIYNEKDMPGHARRATTQCGNLCKMAELIEKPFRLWTRVGIRKNVLHGGAHWRHLTNMIQPSMFGGHPKTAESITMPFGAWTLVGPRNRALNGGPCKSPNTKGQFLGKR